MKQRAEKLIGKAREAVPEGTFAVGAGLLIAALAAYIFVIVALNSIPSRSSGHSAFGVYWGLIYVAGPGFFLPLEQEVGRAIAHRRARGVGGGPLVARAARLGVILAVFLVVATLALSPILRTKVFKGDELLVVGLAIGFVGFFCMHTTRGTLAGNARFRPYGEMLAAEAIVRLSGAIVLALSGVKTAGPYALCISIAPFCAVAFSLRHEKRAELLKPGPPAPYSELSGALGWLLAGSVFMQTLGYAALVSVGLLETHNTKAAAAAFTSAFFVARIPVLLFQAIQGTLLPKLANLAGAGRHRDFRAGLRQLLIIVTAIAVFGTVAAFAIGPQVGKILFKDFTITHFNLGLLAAASGVFIVALTLSQALLALKGYSPAALAWISGVIIFAIVVTIVHDLNLRVEFGFLCGAVVSAVMTAVATRRTMRLGADQNLGALVSKIESEPIEL